MKRTIPSTVCRTVLQSKPRNKSLSLGLRTIAMSGLAASVCLLASCATPTPYQPNSEMGGYKSDQLSATEHVVTFHGNGYSTQAQTNAYALRRAAEITKENGFSHFVVTKSKDLSGTTTTNHGAITSVNYGYIHSTPITASVFRPNTELTIRCYNYRPKNKGRVYTAKEILSKYQ